MTDVSLSLVVALFVVAVAIVFSAFGNVRRFRSEVRKRGISPVTISEYDPDQGFLVVDYVYGGSIGVGSPVVWWSPPCAQDGIDFYSIQLVDLPKSERTAKSVKDRFPGKIVVESTALPAPVSRPDMEKFIM